ncbi:12072_t:CDS:2 [Acaulospora colombiana]|uniref:12072_t:CDS:1 n=1 Tax=Acaulospora colombiana TaxID=27376 RepID=A0ACA9NZQ6_9GLOM|nr:12072_t:CDS:2 [Acaulospora colombiana]
MAADVRALLKAKAQVKDNAWTLERAKRITHPLAAYNQSGQLRCTLCATVVKDNDIAWSGHLGSKAHRTNVGRVKELEKKKDEEARLEKGKRKAVEGDDEGSSNGQNTPGNERAISPASKRLKTTQDSTAAPSNFFSDPTRTLPTADSDEEEEAPNTAPPGPTERTSQIDMEMAEFERDLLSSQAANSALSKQEIFNRATVAGEEQILYDEEEGLPEHLRRSNANANSAQSTVKGVAILEGEVMGVAPDTETPEAARERKEREERELIMDRIMDEERAQEDADEKLRSLKARLALVKQKREEEKKRKLAGKG